ncbi:ankyrin repeat domain-containing protein [Pleionea sp. CnH1-48]|uniref:ankyrin repeat domain-containing protein n=1 Tax=Pleionea sp. CnH1-48 TaxID=2954494 RepID=UPI002096FA9F|nr:ankyrin repeat domain-containing protein [Pleionea sp. CnH1-48]MCO7225745.1 ankyrin repeat domain-containing protein [Pleionea sp. CnH1-48]
MKSVDDTNFMEDTPLRTVCRRGDLEPVKILVEVGSNVNAIGDIGCTPLFDAIGGKSPEVIEYLISSGADPKYQNDRKWTPLSYAISTDAPDEIIAILKKHQ